MPVCFFAKSRHGKPSAQWQIGYSNTAVGEWWKEGGELYSGIKQVLLYGSILKYYLPYI
jgi:hypothetical protein